MTDSITSPKDIPPVPEVQAAKPNVKMPSAIAFAVGLILFIFPFLDIRCNNVSLKKITGMELATGFEVSGPGSNNSVFDGLEKSVEKKGVTVSSHDSKDPNVYAFAGLVLGALGLLLSISNLKAGGIGGVLTGSLAAAAMAGLFIDVRSQIRSGADLWQTDPADSISVTFTPWFYLSVIAFATAAYFSYRRMKV